MPPGHGHGKGKSSFGKPKNMKQTTLRILSYMKEFKLHLALSVVFILLSSIASIAGTYFLKPLINDYILPFIGQQNPDLTAFVRVLCIMGLLYLAGTFATFAYSRLMLTVSTKTLFRIRTEMFDKMQSLPIRYFDTHTHGELMSRFTNDTDTLRNLLSSSLSQFISSAITIIGVFAAMLILSPLLTLLTCIMLVFMLQVVAFIGGRSGMFFRKQQQALGAVNGYIEEMMSGQKVVKVFSYEERAKTRFDGLNNELYSAAANANTYANIMMPAMGNLSYISYAIIAIIGSILVIVGNQHWGPIAAFIIGGLDLGSLAAFLQYNRSFSHPITQISQQFNTLLNALAGAERIFGLMDELPENDEGTVILRQTENGPVWVIPKTDGSETTVPAKGVIEYQNVAFSYTPEKPVLNDINIHAEPGKKIALVGSTGAGKTTITNVMNRFFDISGGCITFDGIDIKTIRKSDLRSTFSVVLQDTHLFTGTVMENIRYGRLNATDEEVIAAAKMANADTFIRHLPEGYQTLLTTDGTNLSQGQRQLLAIARAAVANPLILIFDEATSSIDTRTESLIEHGLEQLMHGRTVFMIAHRLSTVRNADEILVLEYGNVLERGNHEQLMSLKGKYYQLYNGMYELN